MEKSLPKGQQTIEDETLVAHLIQDELFRESIESEFGRLTKIYPDWRTDQLIYEFLNGSSKYSILSEIIKTLKDLGYLKDSMH